MSPAFRLLRALAVITVGLVTLTRCELVVDLDRGEVDGGAPYECTICTNVDSGDDGSAEEDGGSAADSRAEAKASTADASAIAPETEADGGGDAVDSSGQ
jgi:hypothetical protein